MNWRTVGLALVLSLCGAGPALAATITIINNTEEPIVVTVDDKPGCTARPHGSCEVTVVEGPHNLQAKSASDNTIKKLANVTPKGFTWVVGYE